MKPRSYKNAVLALASAVFALFVRGASAQPPMSWPNFSFFGEDFRGRELVAHNVEFEPQSSKPPPKPGSKKSKPSAGSSGGESEKESGEKKTPRNDEHPPPSPSTSSWGLVLGTFAEGDHEQAARTMLDELRRIAPDVAHNCRVHAGSKGSLVAYGDYSGRDDPQTRIDQDRLKKIQFQNRPLFNRVILTRIDTRSMNSQFHPNDLLSVRQKYPRVDPLYTVDIAMWDDLGAGKMKYDEIRAKAEAYAKELRTQGVQAFFYHDDENQRSMVTVGVFDRRAIHPTSGLFSPEVEAVMKKFPARRVNGEPLSEFKDPYHPNEGTKPQTPKLVLVPEL